MSAMRSVVVADHSKFGRVALARVCDLSEAGLLLTDNGIDDAVLNKLKKMQIEIETV